MGQRITVQICAAAVAALVLAGAAASKTFVVTMQITGFEPQMLTVAPGDRVTWVNKDLFPHTATADDKAFDSRNIAPSGTWTFVAGKPGIHAYICTFHPTMKGSIKVQ
jgi:plastocyanin